jgi:hypothetical protein
LGGDQLTGWLQAGTSNEETVDILLLGQFAAVLLADAASVDDTGVLGDVGGDGDEPFANGSVDFLSLGGCGDLASTDGPERIVSFQISALPLVEKGVITR